MRGPNVSVDSEEKSKTIKLSGPPNLSYIANPQKIRKVIKEYDYKGNFSDI